MAYIKILRDPEINEFNSPELISKKEKNRYFNLNLLGRNVEDFSQKNALLGFILQKGYFLSTYKFFLPEKFITEDIIFCCYLLNLNPSKYINRGDWYKKTTRLAHKKQILDFYGFQEFKEKKQLLGKEATDLVNKALKPKQIFYYLINHLLNEKIEIPNYGAIASIITQSLNEVELNFINRLNELLSKEDKEYLDDFIKLPVGDGEISPSNPYLITTLKRPNQDLRVSKIKEDIVQFKVIEEVFVRFESLFQNVEITDALVNYYAKWMIIAEQPQFNSMQDKSKKYLYLLSLIIYQYRMRQDLFVEILIKTSRKFISDINNQVSKDFLEQKTTPAKQVNESKNRLIRRISRSDKLKEVETILIENRSPAEERIVAALSVIRSQPNLVETIQKEFDQLELTISTGLKDEMFYSKVEEGSIKLGRRLKDIVLLLKFDGNTSDKEIYRAIEFYQYRNGNVGSNIPLEFLNPIQSKYIKAQNSNQVNIKIYKSLLFNESAFHIKSGSLNLKYSNNYRSINDYMIDDETWEREKEYLLRKVNLTHLKEFSQVISSLELKLDKQYEKTNQNLSENENLKFRKNGKPFVTNDKTEDLGAEIIDSLLNKDEVIPLIKVLSDIHKATDFADCFTHFALKGGHETPEVEVIFAAIIGLGCNIGARKMGRITQNINSEKLENTVRWYFSKENIDGARNRILKIVDKLSVPQHFKAVVDELHTSSDGQKFGVAVPSIHAGHSYKYFGKGRGVTAYSFIDEYSRVFYDTIISPTEREATYVIDGLLDNEEIESTIHSTDTHGYTEILCGICYSIGIVFAPRIVGDQIIYTFKDRKREHYENKGYRILPDHSRYINVKTLENQWDNILRLLVSIKIKHVKASVIIKRLSSYSQSHPLYRALKELGRIHKSLFMLKYYDESDLRSRMQKQLNKGELWHKFAKDVWFGDNQEFRVGEKSEQEIALGCRTLIQNAIVLWNYLELTKRLSLMDKKQALEVLSAISSNHVISWKHINIHGEYDLEILREASNMFDLEELLKYKVVA